VLISVRDLELTFGDGPVLAGATFHVAPGDRVGLVGVNGSGKSTLLRVMMDDLDADAGQITRKRRLRSAWVSQFLPPELSPRPVLDVAGELLPDGESDHLPRDLLTRLGFGEIELALTAGELSGGWVGRLLLVRAVVSRPDLLLLDEPTNHLDVRSVVAFQRFLDEQVRCSYVLVSHDRALLDAVTDRTLYLRSGKVHAFDVPFSRAREELLEQEAATRVRIAAEERKLDEMRASRERLARWGREHDNAKFARRARSMSRAIAKREARKEEDPFEDRRRLELADGELRARRVVDIEDYVVDAPDGRFLFRIDRLHIGRGDRVLVLGDNGMGKSVFISHLNRAFHAMSDGDEVDGIRITPQATLGYYDQALATLDLDASLYDTLVEHTSLTETRIRSALVGAGFPASSHHRRLSEFSGGERSRVYFLLLRQTRPSLLVLDEPTNHLDLEGCEVLEEELVEKDATVLLVSHDRRFATSIANRYVLLHDGRLEEIFDLEAYYRELSEGDFTATSGAPRRKSALSPDPPPEVDADVGTDADLALRRILELEALLEADLARKPKHQKPDRQAAWRAEIERLHEVLD